MTPEEFSMKFVESYGLATALCILLVGYLIREISAKLDKIYNELECQKIKFSEHHQNAVKIMESQEKLEERFYHHVVTNGTKKEDV